MPELPEVEVTARNLSAWLSGKKIVAAEFSPTRILRGAKPQTFESLIVGRKVQSVDRRGKWIALRLSGGATLFSHLGMTGKWVRRSAEASAEPHERARIDVKGASARYRDPRQFGRLIAAPPGADLPEWRALGRDPLLDGLPCEAIATAIAGTRRSVKEALLDQARIAGLGNIQAQEALFRAKIDPRRAAVALTSRELSALAKGIAASIEHTLAAETGPEIAYVEESGADNPFLVYGRGGEPCPRCRAKLLRVVQGGRTTVYCPNCQGARSRRGS